MSVATPEVQAILDHIDARLDELQRQLGNELVWSYETTCKKLSGVSENFLRELIERGELERIYQGRRPFVVVESVYAYLERRRAEAA